MGHTLKVIEDNRKVFTKKKRKTNLGSSQTLIALIWINEINDWLIVSVIRLERINGFSRILKQENKNKKDKILWQKKVISTFRIDEQVDNKIVFSEIHTKKAKLFF